MTTAKQPNLIASAAIFSAVMLLLSGCAATGGSNVHADDAKAEAVAFLKDTMQHEQDVAWPPVPTPVATRCSDGDDGVRFQYFVSVDTDADSQKIASTLQSYWTSRGLEVKPSQEDFGKYGVMYSATARADRMPWGSYEISSTGINLYVDSQCADGNVSDYE
ncbi:hypothetical protein [Curtobacterium sp. VKM Ac-1395]|uniref:hypothetical protein n=1 Tax=Curtobacterium sp. VKM Ac-1395 TaxID=2783815 RepID=UPI00188BE82E|nr:hypothetical protein [Curtobacterium sp. VKM Ac-1395]MBF4591613.1 hypothetical protein [Curtobacterium sp. VKM Ac-1395]